jgi:hypothetical protein
VIDGQTYSRLQDIIRREGRSLLQYAVDSFPWTSGNEGEAMACLHELAREEAEATTSLARYLVKHRLTPPWLGAYPMAFTSFNFLALDRLLPLLVEHQRRGIADLEVDVRQVEDHEARTHLQHLLEVKRQNLKRLEALVPAAKTAKS